MATEKASVMLGLATKSNSCTSSSADQPTEALKKSTSVQRNCNKHVNPYSSSVLRELTSSFDCLGICTLKQFQQRVGLHTANPSWWWCV
eukprot:1902154-Amphidinium_carterae.1